MHPTLRELKAKPSAEAVDRFIANNAFPLIDRFGATFIYRDLAERDPAEQVILQHWVYGLPASQPFKRLADTGLWYLHLELPPESRIEYKIEVIRNGHGEWITDPLNPALAHDPFGANSVCQGYGYQRPDWTYPDDDALPGQLDQLSVASEAFGERRQVGLYLPARYRRRRRYPLLIVHDGSDFLRFAQLKTVLDNLIHRREVAPLVVALTQTDDRLREYAGDPRHARFLSEELVPKLNQRLALLDEPRGRGLMGASFGGVASLYTAWRSPGLYSRLLLLSGSFAFTDIGPQRRGPVFEPVAEFVNAFRDDPGQVAEQVFLSCGVYESLIYENRSMLPLLREHGLQVRYNEARDGHNWENWRDRLRDGLSWLFPGPLWLFYE